MSYNLRSTIDCESIAAEDLGLLIVDLRDALVSSSKFIGAFESVAVIILGSLTTAPLLGENSSAAYVLILLAAPLVVTLALH